MPRTQRRFVYPAAPAIAAPEALPGFTKAKVSAPAALTAIGQLAAGVKKKLPTKRKAFEEKD